MRNEHFGKFEIGRRLDIGYDRDKDLLPLEPQGRAKLDWELNVGAVFGTGGEEGTEATQDRVEDSPEYSLDCRGGSGILKDGEKLKEVWWPSGVGG